MCSWCRFHAEDVRLANAVAVVPKDGVGHGALEVDVGAQDISEKFEGFALQLAAAEAAWDRHDHTPLFLPTKASRGNARKALRVVSMRLIARLRCRALTTALADQPCGASAGDVRRCLHLLLQIKHVRKPAEQNRLRISRCSRSRLARSRMSRRFEHLFQLNPRNADWCSSRGPGTVRF